MKLTYRQGNDGKGAFVFECEKSERATPKAAGLWFHGSASQCRKASSQWGCGACNAGIEWAWWTPDYPAGRINAAKLIDFADEAAKAALSEHVEAVEGSFAADADIDTPAPDGLSYLPYQRAGIKYAAARDSVLIGDEMGLGKTIQALGLINAKPDIKSVLVIGPASLRINWAREAEKWLCRPFNIHVHEKTKEPVPKDANFVVVSFALCRKGRAAESLMEREFDLVIIDEVHYLKNPKAQQTKAIFGYWDKKTKAAVKGLADKAARKCYLTGTPIQNRPIELHPMLASLAPREFGNFMKFAKRYAAAHQELVGYGRSAKYVWNFGGASNLEELSQRLRATVMVRRLKADVLKELPPKRRQVVLLPANGAASAIKAEAQAFAAYEENVKQLQEAADLAAEAGDENGYLDAVSRLEEGMKVAFEEISRQRHALAVKKIPVVVEHTLSALESLESLVVFAHHHDVVNGILEAVAAEGIKAVSITGSTPSDARQRAVDAFQEGDARVIVGTIGAMGVGLTLTAASTVLFAELDWVPANLSQAEDRCHRIGQDCSVNVIHLIYDESLDAKMAHFVIAKQAIIDRGLDTKIPKQEALPRIGERKRADGTWVAKYPTYPQEVRDAALDAMQRIDSMCDGVIEQDGCGFSAVTRSLGHSLACCEELTDGQTFYALKIARVHHRQLGPGLIERLKPAKAIEAAFRATSSETSEAA